MSQIDPSIGVITQLMDEKMSDAQIIIKQAQQIAALKAAVKIQHEAIAVLTTLLVSDLE